jgi:hypothetical protein
MFEDSFLENGPTFEQQIDKMNAYLQPGQFYKARTTNQKKVIQSSLKNRPMIPLQLPRAPAHLIQKSNVLRP